LDYTWSQFLAFAKSAERRRKQKQEELFVLTFVATRGDEDGVKKMLKSLES